jgi:tetratricopeptide (TPR) repeat protein
MLWLAGSAVVGITLVAALTLVVLKRQATTDVQVVAQASQVKDELASLRDELRAALAPKPLAQGQTVPEPLPPALMDKARILLARGNAEDQALARIGLKQHAEADGIIQDLKRKPGNPIDEAFRLLTMEGDNWYQAGQPDKAIEPYEQALALRRADINAQRRATVAHTFARLGNIAAHQSRAIELAEGSLKLTAPGSADWAMTEINLGNAWQNLPTGDQSEHRRKAIAAYEAALTVYTRDAAPARWATTQNNLGAAWADMPTGDRGANLRKAIAAYDAALTVRTRSAAPADWAMTQNNLGLAWSKVATGDQGTNLRKAMAAYAAALTVYTKDAAPADWAMTQNNLGLAWSKVPTGNRGENLRKAIAAYEAALTVYTIDAYPDRSLMIRTSLSGCQILTRDFKGALATAEGASQLIRQNPRLETNLAHALLFLDRTDEAKAMYLKHVGEKIDDKTWQEVVLQDFDYLEKEGLTHPQFQTVREQLKTAR